jgi:hypothetical protein
MNAKWQKALQKQAMQKLETAFARAQGDGVVDLARAKSDTRIAILHFAIEEVWDAFAAGVDADIAEKALQHLEARLNSEVFWSLTHSLPIADRRADEERHAAHRAARGVRKVRGAK